MNILKMVTAYLEPTEMLEAIADAMDKSSLQWFHILVFGTFAGCLIGGVLGSKLAESSAPQVTSVKLATEAGAPNPRPHTAVYAPGGHSSNYHYSHNARFVNNTIATRGGPFDRQLASPPHRQSGFQTISGFPRQQPIRGGSFQPQLPWGRSGKIK